jgi:hypothetical protein
LNAAFIFLMRLRDGVSSWQKFDSAVKSVFFHCGGIQFGCGQWPRWEKSDMTRFRLTGFALALAFLGGAARSGGEETEPRIEVHARAVQQDAKRVQIEVAARAPLPDGIVMVVELWQAGGFVRAPFATRRAAMSGGYCNDVMRFQYLSEIQPGDYRVTVRVDETRERAKRLPPSLRRLAGEDRILVGGRAHRFDRINQLTKKILFAANTLHKLFPELEKMLELAYNKQLPDANWRQWAKNRMELETSRDKLVGMTSIDNNTQLMPMTMTQIYTMTTIASNICKSIEDYLKGNVKNNDTLLKPRKKNKTDHDFEDDAMTKLFTTLYWEGGAAYASAAEQIFLDVDAAYARLRGTGSEAWGSLRNEWSKMIDEVKEHMKAFDKLDWPVDRGDWISQLEDALIEIKVYANLCGSNLKVADEAPERTAKRNEILRRFSQMIK